MRLVLVRHGLSSFNREGRIQGRDNLSFLTDEGINQAHQTGKALGGIPIKAVYSSPLQRASQTALKLTESQGSTLTPIFDDGLLEVDLTPWSGLTPIEIKEKFPDQYKCWQEEPGNLVLKRSNGESFRPLEDLMNQAHTFLESLIRKHPIETKETILVVAHNAILRCLIINLIGKPNLGFRRIKLGNTSISILNIISHQKGKFRTQIECLNSTAHLEAKLPKKTDHARIILVRHGETDWNKQGRFQGQIDIPLNKNGHKQASAAGNFLSHLNLDKAYSSSMTRPKETAEEILSFHKNIPLKLEDNLKEINHGKWEGKLETEIDKKWPKLLKEWKLSPEKVEMPDGETIQKVWDRSVKCFTDIASELNSSETALLVAHDAVNKTILCNLLGLKASDIWMIKQGNGGVTIIDINKNHNQPDIVTCLNLTFHLGGILDMTAEGAL